MDELEQIYSAFCALPAEEELASLRVQMESVLQTLKEQMLHGLLKPLLRDNQSKWEADLSKVLHAGEAIDSASTGLSGNGGVNYDPWRQWFSDHLDHPYYDNRQRDGLLRQVKGMTPQKMATWFINVRRRSGWSEFSKRYAEGKQEKIAAILEAIDNPDPFTSAHVDPGARALVTRIRDYLTLESKRTVIMPWLANLLEDYKKGQTNSAFNKQVSETAAAYSPSSSLSSLSPLSSIDSIDLASRSPTPTRTLSPSGNRSGHKREASDSIEEHEQDNNASRALPSKRARSSTSRAPAFAAALSAEPVCAPATPVRGQTKAQQAEALRNGTEGYNVSDMQAEGLHAQLSSEYALQATAVAPYAGPASSTRSQFDAIAGYSTTVEEQPSYMLTPEISYATQSLVATPAWQATQPYMQQISAQNTAMIAWSPEMQWTHVGQAPMPFASYNPQAIHAPHVVHAQAPMSYPPAGNMVSKKRRYSEDAEMPSTPTYKRACISQPSKETIYELPQYETMLNAHVDPHIMQVMPQEPFGNINYMSAPMQRSEAQPNFHYMNYYAAVPQVALAGPGAYANYPQYFNQSQC